MTDKTKPASQATTGPVPKPGIMDIHAYVGGKSLVDGVDRIIKLSSNESALGASPRAMEAYRSMADKLHLYPDGGSTALRDAIAAHYGVEADRIVCGAGSDEILNLLTQAYAGPGDEVLFTEHGFLVYRLAAMSNGATPVAAPETDNRTDVDKLLAAVTPRTKILFLANPNNPTGTYIPTEDVVRLHQGLPDHVLLVLDAAYAEFVRRNDYDPGFGLVRSAANVVMTRTFSKIYGLAGLRLGWSYCPQDVADVLNRIRGPFNTSHAAQMAGVAALQDIGFTEQAVNHNEEWLAWLGAEIAGLGLNVTESVANFLLVDFPDRDGKRAADADAFLQTRGLIVRRMDEYNFPNALRISVGLAEDNQVLVSALREFMAQ